MDRTLMFVLVGVGGLAFATWAGVAAELWRPRSKRHLRTLAWAEAISALLAIVSFFVLMEVDLERVVVLGLFMVFLLVRNLGNQRFCSSCGHRVANLGLAGGWDLKDGQARYCRLDAQPLVRLREVTKSPS
jgi:hypothetical protein